MELRENAKLPKATHNVSTECLMAIKPAQYYKPEYSGKKTKELSLVKQRDESSCRHVPVAASTHRFCEYPGQCDSSVRRGHNPQKPP